MVSLCSCDLVVFMYVLLCLQKARIATCINSEGFDALTHKEVIVEKMLEATATSTRMVHQNVDFQKSPYSKSWRTIEQRFSLSGFERESNTQKGYWLSPGRYFRTWGSSPRNGSSRSYEYRGFEVFGKAVGCLPRATWLQNLGMLEHSSGAEIVLNLPESQKLRFVMKPVQIMKQIFKFSWLFRWDSSGVNTRGGPWWTTNKLRRGIWVGAL